MMTQALLPIHMGVEKLVYESLGFVFRGTDGRDFHIATLPEGWYIQKFNTNGVEHSTIFDRLARPRVEISTGSYVDDRKGDCHLVKRYIVRQGTANGKHFYVLYDQGEYISLLVSDSYDPRNHEHGSKCLKFVTDCLKHLYPRHEDPLAYW